NSVRTTTSCRASRNQDKGKTEKKHDVCIKARQRRHMTLVAEPSLASATKLQFKLVDEDSKLNTGTRVHMYMWFSCQNEQLDHHLDDPQIVNKTTCPCGFISVCDVGVITACIIKTG